MSEREKEIRELVKTHYDKDRLDSPEELEELSKKMVDKYLSSSITIDELSLKIKERQDIKKQLEYIRKNNYKMSLSVEKVAKSIGNVPDEAIEDLLIELSTNDQISIEEIITASVEKFKVYRDIDVNVDHDLPKVIEQILNSDELKHVLTGILSNPETAGEHNSIALDGAFLSANIIKNNAVLGFVTNYIVVHQGTYKIEELYETLEKSNINGMTNDELNDFFAKIIVKSVQERLHLEDTTNPDNKKQIIDFVYNNFIKNGYCYQGTNSSFRKDIETKGLTTEFSRATDNDLQEVDKIFKKHGLGKIFYSKLSETAEAPYYYTTDGMETAYHYSYHNPEYFSYFVASGNNMPDGKYDRMAYYLRDSKKCRENLEKLCRHYHLTPEEQEKVMMTYNKLSAKLITDDKNTVTLVARKLINKDHIDINLDNVDDISVEDMVGKIISTKEGSQGTKHHIPIPPEKIDVISVPSLETIYDKEKLEGREIRKYIPLQDGSKYYYDILLNSDKIDYDCITIADQEPNLFSTKSRDWKQPGKDTIDIITCPKTIGKDTLLTNGSISFQSLQMMIAVNGKANSKEGEELLQEARKNYSPQYMSNYYYHLCDLSCQIALDKNQDSMARYQAIIRMAKDFYPKAEKMRITGDYPEFISEENNMVEYLPYYDRIQIKGVEALKNGQQVEVRSDVLEYCATFFKQQLEGKVNPEFTAEFDKKMNLYGAYQIYDPKKEDNSNELSSMFEQSTEKTTEIKIESIEKPKVMTYTSNNHQSSSNDGGIISLLSLALVLGIMASITITAIILLS